MKKNHETVESLLATGKDTGLSVSERADMWQELRSYAVYHAPAKDTVVVKRFSFARIMRFATATAAVVFVSVGTGYASYNSLPGEPLYTVKVNMVEPVLGFSHSSEKDQLNYQVSLLERRLFEMKELSEAELLTEESVVALETKVEEHSSEITEIIASDSDASVTAKERLDVLGDVVTTLRTHEFIEDIKVGKGRASKFRSTEDSVSALYASEATRFAGAEPSEAVEYIADAIQELDTSLSDEGVASSTVSEVNDILEDAEEALSEGNIDEALNFTGEAKQVIDLNFNIEVINHSEEDEAEVKEKQSGFDKG
ncbi:MAG: hypothetical protein KBC62_03735 [Candidatus Pacebacteria bacterium]|nr:hypothetical protein [Candidatus Paceibacterota bacterium]MBP9843091.1 hypothetical protein [Candidatus Paceibacterota bacterium]